MKRINLFIMLLPCIAALGAACTPENIIYPVNGEEAPTPDGGLYYPAKPSPDDPVTDGFAPEGYRLVWSDEFNNPATLKTEWRFEKGGTGWGNNELQYYCADGVYTPTGQQTARISGGSLLLTAYKITPSDASQNMEYISTRMNTNKNWKYGYIEMRAKLPAVRGTWPAFWMLPADGQYHISDGGGELDIMEWVGKSPGKVWFSAHCQNVTSGSSQKYRDPVTGEEYPHSLGIEITDAGSKFHCFGMEWTHEYVKAFLDGVEYYYGPNTYPDKNDVTWWPFDKEYYLKLNLAIGGSWGGTVDPNFTSAVYEIDWVRVYQK